MKSCLPWNINQNGLKGLSISLILFLALLLSPNNLLAQCGSNTQSGNNCNTRSNFFYGELVPNLGITFVSVNNFGPGQYFRMPVLPGACYTVSTCGSTIDTQVSAFQGATTVGSYAWNDDNGPACTGLDASITITPNFNDYTRVQVRQFNCQVSGTTSTTVRVRQNNNLQITSSAANMCAGETRNLTATPAPVGTSRANAGNLGTFSGTGVSGTVFIAPTPAGASQVYPITYTYGYVSTTQNITVFRNPSTAMAGSDQTVPAPSTTLGGNTPAFGTGTWSIISGLGGSIGSMNDPNSTFNGIAGNTYTLRWTITNGPCTASTDDVDITFITPCNNMPLAICQNATVQLDGAGNASITASDVDGGSSVDVNCGPAMLSVAPSSFTCADTGPQMVTLTVMDTGGNSAMCTATVDVEDNIPPTAVCQNITVQIPASGVTVSITPGDIDGGSTDNCGITSNTVNGVPFVGVNCNTVGGLVNLTLEVTDAAGNSDNCTANVVIEDNVAPVAVCQDLTVQLDATGNASITGADVDNGSNDACGIANLNVSPDTFDCTDVGNNTVTLAVTDNNGNTSTCTATVTIEDNVPPSAVCQDITAQLDGAGLASITASDVEGGSTDACGINGFSVNVATFNCSDVGANTVTVTVTDNNGNVDACMSTVTVEDNVPPVAVCQDATIQLNAAGMGTLTAGQVDGGSTDNCPPPSVSVSPDQFTCSDVGTNPVTLTVMDGSGNSATCTATVTVEDNVAPNAVCQDITVQLDANGNGSITAADIDGGSTDVCGVSGLSANPAIFDCDDIGDNSATLSVTDVNGNTSSCTSTVTVEDNNAPTAVCADFTANIIVYGPMAFINASDVDGGSFSVCNSVSLSVLPNSFTCDQLGDNTVTLTVTDDVNEETATCTATVTVEDPNTLCNAPPVALCQDITVDADSNCQAAVSPDEVDNGSSDPDDDPITLSLDPMGPYELGTTMVTLTVSDGDKMDQCTATITVEDNESPQFCGASSAAAAAYDDGWQSGDNDGDGFGPWALGFPFGGPPPSAAEAGHFVFTSTINGDGDDNGDGDIDTADRAWGLYANSDFTASALRLLLHPFTVGSSLSVKLDFGDMTGTGNPPRQTMDLNMSGVVNLRVSAIPSQPNYLIGNSLGTTNTGIPRSDEGAQFDFVALAPQQVMVTVTPLDGSPGGVFMFNLPFAGFMDRLQFVNSNGGLDSQNDFFINDLVICYADEELCADDQVYAADDGECSATIDIPTVTAVDNCEVTVLRYRYRPANENCGNISGQGWSNWTTAPMQTLGVGKWRIQWEARDAANNRRRCVFCITIEDTEDPTITCPNDITVDNDPNDCDAVVDFSAEINDNCPEATVSYSQDPGTFFPVGTTTVTATVTDASGNTAACSFDITVEDVEDPNISCGGLSTTVPNDPGECEADVLLPIPPATDNCIVEFRDFRYRPVNDNNQNSGPWLIGWTGDFENDVTLDVGRYRVRWRATDEAGNTDFCSYIFVVEDVEPPVINCTNAQVIFNGEEYIDLIVDDIATATDNCEVESVELDIVRIFCEELGDQITVTATATDVNGLTSTCTSKVDVLGLPCGWSQQEDGVGCEDGNSVSYSVPEDEFTVSSTDCYNSTTTDIDEYAFAQYNLCGNGSIIAEVTSLTGNAPGWAGVTMRADNDPLSQHVSLMTNLFANHRVETRLTYGGSVTSSMTASFNRRWLRIDRVGNNFTGRVSFNGFTWFYKFSIQILMPECIEVGLIVNSSNPGGDNSATFANVSVTGATFFELEAIQPSADDAQFGDRNFSVFPNPTTGRATIQLDDFLDQEGELEILDINGKLVQPVRSGLLEYGTEEVDLSSLPAGMYFVRLRMADGTVQTQRVILQPRP